MSASKAARRRPRARRKIAPAAVLPLTVSRPALLQAGSDRRFRALVHDLLTVSTRMEIVRAHLGDRIGIVPMLLIDAGCNFLAAFLAFALIRVPLQFTQPSVEIKQDTGELPEPVPERL